MIHHPSYCQRLFRNVAVLGLALGLFSTALAAEASKSFDIAAGDAVAALKQFSAQAGVQLLYSTDELAGVRTAAVKGELAPRAALDALLKDTGLVAAADAKTGALAVKRDAGPNAARAIAENSDRPESSVKVEDGVVKMGQFEVFGSKLINADIPRTRDDVQPYVVFDRDQIEGSNALNLGEFLRTRLPMNNAGAITPAVFNSASTNSAINLRGLGTNQTLILVDGRRIPARNAGPAGIASMQGDVNGIPLSMIERVEILPSTAAGIHGGGATGGVINVITRKDYSGVEVTLSYANTFDTDASNRRVDVNGSLNLEDGKTFLTFSSTYSDGTSLLTQDRDFAQHARALQLANNPAAFYGTSVTPPVGYTPNIRSSTGVNLVLKNGTPLASPFTHVPAGYSGSAADGGAALVAQAGTYNLVLPRTESNGGLNGARAVPEVQSWAIGARRTFGSKVEVYVDASAQKNIGRSPGWVVSPTSVTLPVTAPNNPFTTPVVVSYPVTHASFIRRTDNNNSRVSAGVVVRLPRDWSASADYVWSKSRSHAIQGVSGGLGDPDGTGPRPSYSSALTAGTLNVLRDLNAFPLDYAPYQMPVPVAHFDYSAEAWEGTFKAAGPSWELPAGPVSLAFNSGLRREEQPENITETPSTVPSGLTWSPPAAVDQRWAYLEARAPVFPEKSTSLLRALEIQGSLRYDAYRTESRPNTAAFTATAPNDPRPASYTPLVRKLHATSGMVGFKYSPVRDVALRASWGTGFLPPSVAQLAPMPPINSTGVNLTDPKRGGVLANTGAITLLFGGNPALNPEHSESVSGGLIFTPRSLPGLRLSVDYTRIEKQDEITELTSQQALDHEDMFPGSVERAPLTAADQALGYTGGRITSISSRSINVAKRLLVAYDFQVEYTADLGKLGRFHPYVSATYQPKFASQVLPNAAFLNGVGFTGPLRWRGNAGLDWKLGRWSAGWNVQYNDSYLGYASNASAATIANFLLNQGTGRIPSQTYHDIYAGYEFGRAGEGWRRHLRGTRVTAGVQNVFSTSPPILAGTAAIGGFSGYGDPLLARYTITVRRQF